MGQHKESILAISILFILGCFATSAQEFADKKCWPPYSYNILWGYAGNTTIDDRVATNASERDIRKAVKDSSMSNIKTSSNSTSWLTKMNISAPKSVVNDTKAMAFRVEKEGWRILGADFQWWWVYYMEDDWSLQKEYNGLKDAGYENLDPLEDIRLDLDLYSGVAFPCNSTLSMTLQDDNGENPNVSTYGSDFISKFKNKMAELNLADNMTSDLVTEYLKEALLDEAGAANRTANATDWKVAASYMGVGWDVECWGDINTALNMATEWDKAASSAATTLMALIPVLLTFGNLILPRDSEAFCSSFLVGIMSAAFSLGLPGMSISAIMRRLHRIDIGSWEHHRQSMIARLGEREENDGIARPKAFCKVTLASLRTWLTAPPDHGAVPSKLYTEGLSNGPVEPAQMACSYTFWHVRHEVEKWKKRPHYWHVFGILVFLLQVGIFIAGIAPLFLNMGTPLFMFSCDQNFSSLWMPITAAINATFRFIMWEFSSHERVRVYALSEKAKQSLDEFIQMPKYAPNGDTDGIPKSTETELVPLYHPLIGRALRAYYRKFSSSATSLKKQYRRISRQNNQGTDGPDSLYSHNEDIDTLIHSVIHQIRFFWYHWVRFAITRPWQFIQVGFWHGDSTTESARRWRPVTVLMHLSSGGRNPFSKLLTGLMEGAILLLLTIFFAAQWGGNIYVVSYSIALLLVFVTAGRILSLLYIWQSAKTLGLHVIECQSNSQISGALRILCSMTGVLVVVNGAYFYDGRRLDERQGWNNWRVCYDRGDYDDDDDDDDDDKGTRSRSRSGATTGGDSAQIGKTSGFRQALNVGRKPVSARQDLPRHRSDGSQSEILLQDISYHARTSSENTLHLVMPRAPETTAGHP